MATVHPPPPPPPPSSVNRPPAARSPPRPLHAAVPWNFPRSPPAQETGAPPDAPEEASAPSPPTEQNGSQSPHEDHMCDGEEKSLPVQETEPVLLEIQIIEAGVHDEEGSQEDGAGETSCSEAL